MISALHVYLPYVISAMTIWVTILQGKLHRHAWALCLMSQTLWLVWIITDQAWGMLPLNAFMFAVAVRFHLKWRNLHAVSDR